MPKIVHRARYKSRKAIAMIELIFAIVVMGIVMLSVPNLLKTSVEGTYTALQQESIAAAVAQMNMIMTAEWDEQDTNILEGAPVLRTASPNIANCTTDHPPGVTSASGRYCKGLSTGAFFVATPPANLGKEATDGSMLNDVDDYNNLSYQLAVYNNENYTTTQGNYIDTDINITSRVYYGDDRPNKADGTPSAGGYDKTMRFSNPFRTIVAAGSRHIKLVTLTLTSSNSAGELSSDKRITLSAFMCNIGAPKKDILTNRP